MSGIINEKGTGWLPDFPDFRDYTLKQDKVEPMIKQVGVEKTLDESNLPTSTDLREWCSPIKDQGKISSCTANAGVSMVEYYEKRSFGKYLDESRLFLYKTTRNLMQKTGDSGAYIRKTMESLVLFGLPPEEYWPYNIESFDMEPSTFCYAFGQSYKTILYVRLDPLDGSKDDLLNRIKTNLVAGLPTMFGFTVYSSITNAASNGEIPFPGDVDRLAGGHAVMTVGYDDSKKIKIPNSDKETNGALLIRNSWGEKWGEKGYGWLPYDYVRSGLAVDWWTILKNDWIDTGVFKI